MSPSPYPRITRVPLAVDCIVFGFDASQMQILLVRRALKPAAGEWSLPGGFVEASEDVPAAARRILQRLTGLRDIFLEELAVFSQVDRDPAERVVSVAFLALIDILRYDGQLTPEYQAAWFPLRALPSLVFDHGAMVDKARQRLKFKAAFQPLLFELLPPKFTLPQLHRLYEDLFDTEMDKRNFVRQLTASGLLVKLDEKDKSGSRKGAYLYRLDSRRYHQYLHSLDTMMPLPGTFSKRRKP